MYAAAMITRMLLVILMVGCGGAAASTPAEEPPSPAAAEPVAQPAQAAQPTPDEELDPMICSVDADCMVGTPRDCCTTFCGDDAVAWSLSAWAAYQDLCSIVECEQTETIACRPGAADATPPIAVCRSERCVLSLDS